MSKISVDIPDAVLGEKKAKEIQSLRSKVKRLERKVGDLEQKLAQGKEAVARAQELRMFVADTMDLYKDPWDDD